MFLNGRRISSHRLFLMSSSSHSLLSLPSLRLLSSLNPHCDSTSILSRLFIPLLFLPPLSKPSDPSLLLYGPPPPSRPPGYLPSPPLPLTQQYDDAQQDGDQSPRAETGRGQERLALARPDPPVALAGADPQREGAGAAQRRLPAVPHHDGELVQLLGQAVEAPAPGDDAGRAVCNDKG